MHHKKTCRPSTQSAQIESLLNSNKQYMFPETLSISEKFMAAISPPRKNGGWGDIRDHELCKSYRRLQWKKKKTQLQRQKWQSSIFDICPNRTDSWIKEFKVRVSALIQKNSCKRCPILVIFFLWLRFKTQVLIFGVGF